MALERRNSVYPLRRSGSVLEDALNQNPPSIAAHRRRQADASVPPSLEKQEKCAVIWDEDFNDTIMREHGGPEVEAMVASARSVETSWDRIVKNNHTISTRIRVIEWLATQFDRQGMRDEWLIAAVCLYDRLCMVTSQTGELFSKGPMAPSLAMVLSALKMGGAEAAMDKGLQDVLQEMSRGKWGPALWKQIQTVELRAIGLLDYKLATPTPLEIISRLAYDIIDESMGEKEWPGLMKVIEAKVVKAKSPWIPRLGANPGESLPFDPTRRFWLFANFLAELGLTHAVEETYSVHPMSLGLAVAALQISLEAYDAPQKLMEGSLQHATSLLGTEADKLPPLLRALRNKANMAQQIPLSSSPVVATWKARISRLRMTWPEVRFVGEQPTGTGSRNPSLQRRLSTPNRPLALEGMLSLRTPPARCGLLRRSFTSPAPPTAADLAAAAAKLAVAGAAAEPSAVSDIAPPSTVAVPAVLTSKCSSDADITMRDAEASGESAVEGEDATMSNPKDGEKSSTTSATTITAIPAAPVDPANSAGGEEQVSMEVETKEEVPTMEGEKLEEKMELTVSTRVPDSACSALIDLDSVSSRTRASAEVAAELFGSDALAEAGPAAQASQAQGEEQKEGGGRALRRRNTPLVTGVTAAPGAAGAAGAAAASPSSRDRLAPLQSQRFLQYFNSEASSEYSGSHADSEQEAPSSQDMSSSCSCDYQDESVRRDLSENFASAAGETSETASSTVTREAPMTASPISVLMSSAAPAVVPNPMTDEKEIILPETSTPSDSSRTPESGSEAARLQQFCSEDESDAEIEWLSPEDSRAISAAIASGGELPASLTAPRSTGGPGPAMSAFRRSPPQATAAVAVASQQPAAAAAAAAAASAACADGAAAMASSTPRPVPVGGHCSPPPAKAQQPQEQEQKREQEREQEREEAQEQEQEQEQPQPTFEEAAMPAPASPVQSPRRAAGRRLSVWKGGGRKSVVPKTIPAAPSRGRTRPGSLGGADLIERKRFGCSRCRKSESCCISCSAEKCDAYVQKGNPIPKFLTGDALNSRSRSRQQEALREIRQAQAQARPTRSTASPRRAVPSSSSTGTRAKTVEGPSDKAPSSSSSSSSESEATSIARPSSAPEPAVTSSSSSSVSSSSASAVPHAASTSEVAATAAVAAGTEETTAPSPASSSSSSNRMADGLLLEKSVLAKPLLATNPKRRRLTQAGQPRITDEPSASEGAPQEYLELGTSTSSSSSSSTSCMPVPASATAAGTSGSTCVSSAPQPPQARCVAGGLVAPHQQAVPAIPSPQLQQRLQQQRLQQQQLQQQRVPQQLQKQQPLQTESATKPLLKRPRSGNMGGDAPAPPSTATGAAASTASSPSMLLVSVTSSPSSVASVASVPSSASSAARRRASLDRSHDLAAIHGCQSAQAKRSRSKMSMGAMSQMAHGDCPSWTNAVETGRLRRRLKPTPVDA